MAPSCVPASPYESPRRALTPGDLEALMRAQPGARAGRDDELPRRRQRPALGARRKLQLEGAEHVDGHAPGLLGKGLQAYAASGIRSDHEALTARRAASDYGPGCGC